MIHPDFKAMAISIPRLLQVDFANLRDPVPDYASHTLITPTHMRLLRVCAVHYDLDFGLVTCYLGGEYTAEWRDVNEIISTCKPIVSPEVLSQMERILTTGCPLYFNWEEDAANKRALSLGATSLPPHSTVTWLQKRSQRRSPTATSSQWRGGFAHAHHGVGTSLRTSKSSPGRSPT